jgi:hypothetical protein
VLFCDASGCGKVGFAFNPLQKLANLILSATLASFSFLFLSKGSSYVGSP